MIIEYSPSSRAACRGPRPCSGTKIEKGALRLGEPTENMWSNDTISYQYRHWGCTTPQILNKIKRSGGARNIKGFTSLSLEDQHRVSAAVERGKVDPDDVPFSARTVDSRVISALAETIKADQKQTTGASSGQKRKRDEPSAPSSSQFSSSSVPSRLPASSQQTDYIDISSSSEEEEVVPVKRPRLENPAQSTSSHASGSRSANPIAASMNAGPNEAALDPEGLDNNENVNEEEMYVTLSTEVVGVQYYDGMVGIGEQVDLLRQPTNQYDRNAIQVVNISGRQVGHLPRLVASRLAPLMDQDLVSVEGTMTSGNLRGKNPYKLSIDITIFGPSNPASRKRLEPYLIWATPGQKGFEAMRSQTGAPGTSMRGRLASSMDSARAAQLSGIIANLSKLDDSSRRETLLNTLCGDDVLELPVHPSPPSLKSGHLNTDLLKHQKQALKWCIDAENPVLPKKQGDKPVQFWQIKSTGSQTYYYNIATKTPQVARPVLGRGGIIGDDMGLGKTLTVLSLIVATHDDEPSSGYSGATLIVAPLSVMSNWSNQIEEHLTEDCGIKAHVYYGDGRNVSASFLKKQDIVITTYQTLTADMPTIKATSKMDGSETLQVTGSRSGLFGVKWKRCVLDEGHTIRNPKTQAAKACYLLEAERRWVVSGTPIINSPSDLGSLLRFLRICNPLDQPEYFKRLLSKPLSKRDPQAVELLKILMNSCCLRRTKEMQDKDGKALVPLPPVTFNVVKVQLDDETRNFYDLVESQVRTLVQEYVTHGGRDDQMPPGVNVLSMLTRLRQIALDRRLVPATYLDDLTQITNNHRSHSTPNHPPSAPISEQECSRLQDLLAEAINNSEECPICFDTLNDPRITVCAHRFCFLCISEVIRRQAACPLDRRVLLMDQLIVPRPPQADEEESDDDSTSSEDIQETPSAKIVQLIELLRLQPSDSKSLVFSQFTSFLDKIGAELKKAQIPFVRFDGSMSAKKRQAVLDAFSRPLVGKYDPDKTEPESNDEGYQEYWNKRKGKGKANTGRSTDYSSGENPVVMLISLKSGALGLNCTVANNVFLMDPWWQEAIESQAIDRVNRLGQKKNVFVYQMVAEDTIEAKVLQIQERKKELIKQAFSGTTTKQTQRQKKEARLQELMELFPKNDNKKGKGKAK
ncbi:hypothetical protein CPB86DRAFT_784078 [Serendipita vermifera]|nr:hypothetical protein CPB86DRAFT_784078 [Serendipita vermifera]